MRKSKTLLVAVLALLVLAGGFSGCKSKDKKKQSRVIKGIVESIDLANNIVTMNFFNEKVGKNIPLASPIYKDTEIYIDGKLADISQLKENDPVVVEGFKKGADLHPTKITVIHLNKQIGKIIKNPTTRPAK
jgi:hypothetical protein